MDDLIQGLGADGRRKMAPASRKILDRLATKPSAAAAAKPAKATGSKGGSISKGGAGSKRVVAPVAAPLPRNIREKQERKAGYEFTKEDVTKWQPIVKVRCGHVVWRCGGARNVHRRVRADHRGPHRDCRMPHVRNGQARGAAALVLALYSCALGWHSSRKRQHKCVAMSRAPTHPGVCKEFVRHEHPPANGRPGPPACAPILRAAGGMKPAATSGGDTPFHTHISPPMPSPLVERCPLNRNAACLNPCALMHPASLITGQPRGPHFGLHLGAGGGRPHQHHAGHGGAGGTWIGDHVRRLI